MGLFTKIFGGDESKSTQSSESGYRLLPQDIKNSIEQYARQTTNMFKTPSGAESMFRPEGFSAQEQSILDRMLGNGYAPTASTVASDIELQMNPYNDAVINEINRQAQGENSILKQNATAAGQFGSNRQMLGANDIDLTRMDRMRSFLSDQYNTSLQNALTTLPQARLQSDLTGLSSGEAQRQLAEAQRLVPLTALQAYGGLLGALPTDGGSISSGMSKSLKTDGITGPATRALAAISGFGGATQAASGGAAGIRWNGPRTGEI